jgi:hypothetical protein
MGDTNGNDDGFAARRAFVRRLRADEDVRRVDFSRDGFRTVVVEPDPGAGFRRRWYRTATRLGYTVRRTGTEDPASDRRGDVWVLQLEGTDGSVDRPAWRRRLGRAIRRVREFFDRLVGRSGR